MKSWVLEEANENPHKELRQAPTAADVMEALFREEPLEWNRIAAFTDVTFLKLSARLLKHVEESMIYVQGDHTSWTSIPCGPPCIARDHTYRTHQEHGSC